VTLARSIAQGIFVAFVIVAWVLSFLFKDICGTGGTFQNLWHQRLYFFVRGLEKAEGPPSYSSFDMIYLADFSFNSHSAMKRFTWVKKPTSSSLI